MPAESSPESLFGGNDSVEELDNHLLTALSYPNYRHYNLYLAKGPRLKNALRADSECLSHFLNEPRQT
jgi:hypothetical protein